MSDHPDSKEYIELPDDGRLVPYWRFQTWHEVETIFDAIPLSDCMNVLKPEYHPAIDGIFYSATVEDPDQVIAAYSVSEDFERWESWEITLNAMFPERRILDETFPERNGL